MAKKKAQTCSSPSADAGSGDTGGHKDSPDQDEAVCFEDSLSEIEQIVSQLESGELGLAESLDRYEAAVRQLKTCHRLLEQAERRVTILSGFDADGNPVTEPLEQDPDDSLEGKRRSRSRRRGAAGDPSRSSTAKSQQNSRTSGSSADSVDDPQGLF